DHTQGSETYGSIFYTYKEEGTYWSSPQILLNDSIYYNPILVTNSRNKICLIYGEEHKNNNYQFNFIEKLPGK
ncbi:MAG: hypothetical protein U9O98_08955, partial [Asgard group archaeon]|nr:hypothetical protein [Asgard group archaeon]